MKKQASFSNSKLLFSKEKIAHLSAPELAQIVGGAAQADCNSSRHDFTCQLCTGVTHNDGQALVQPE
ncbi:class I lanthipeptide [Hymenobacter lucidus]|uniref:Class I lanthipeptide n=1 Tax=Hymenobacter lucidus TaxID=2880930 RepID=A0ABS8AVY3_9BACT|nr:class I lanthipeptide [Hymenobacter lucidus]MCB2409839.1 class I lanthipeptide [Hymenobacter lucidus]